MEVIMLDNFHFQANRRGRSKAGVTIHLDPKDGEGGFEATVSLDKNKCDTEADDATRITAKGKLTFSVGKRGYVELFGETSESIDDVLPTAYWGEI
jgi:hypothetical protein